jgi:hypothetical protein
MIFVRRRLIAGEPARDQGAAHGADQDHRDEELAGAGRDVEILVDEEDRAADHAGVEAEEEAAERGDRGHAEQELVARGLAEEARARLARVRAHRVPSISRRGRRET